MAIVANTGGADLQFREMIQPFCADATESEVRLTLYAADSSVIGFRGVLEGPFCVHARTLPTVFSLESNCGSSLPRPEAELVVAEPCYWTPKLPFLYRLNLELEFVDGTKVHAQEVLGLRGWQLRWPNLLLNGERIVLRGAACHTGGIDVERARLAELALIIPAADISRASEASRLGVAVIADFRGEKMPLGLLARLAWEPSVVAALFDRTDGSISRRGWPFVAALLDENDGPSRVNRPWDRIFTVEIDPSQRPAAWLASCGAPVIAIRRGVSYADLHEARAACDQLQADLAPEFNLAGYFVAPE